MRKYYACVKGHRENLVSFYMGITTNLLQEVRKMKKRKRLRPFIKNALKVVAMTIFGAIILATFIYGMFMYHGTMTERYADPAYCEVRGN